MSEVENPEEGGLNPVKIRSFSSLAKDEVSRQRKIIEMPEFIRHKAATISAHFLLPSGALVVDMGCVTGEITYTLALLNPLIEFIGIDRDPHVIDYARKTYQLPNLSFRVDDASVDNFEDESVDLIINSNILHVIYSAHEYDSEAVIDVLGKQIKKLKTGGIMLVRDYMVPPDDEYVLLEFPDIKSTGDTPKKMSDPDLLILFSQTARPLHAHGCEGFFLEEIEAAREDTRLFRLPHKWALEFIHRKDHRESWEKELALEYSFFSYQDFKREFVRLGMRMMYSGPTRNPWVVKNLFQGKFQLYTEEGIPKPPPATNYFVLSQKVANKEGLILEERRPSQDQAQELEVITVVDKKTGKVHEVARRPGEYCDVIPYRITKGGRVVIYVRSGYPRPIVNAVQRGTHNLDGKRWSGHLIEPITMDTVGMTEDPKINKKMILDFVEDYAGLKVLKKDSLYVGVTYFPSPETIDEAIEPVFVQVAKPRKSSWPIEKDGEKEFSSLGMISELDGSDIIRASEVGLLPEPRLEIHVFDLMNRYGIKMPEWIGETFPLPGKMSDKVEETEDILDSVEPSEFSEPRKGGKHLKPVRSVFIEEGKVGNATRGLSSKDVEFIVSEDGVENIAIILPLTRGWDDNLMVALKPETLPLPQRLGGSGNMLTAPSFVLPKDVRTIDDAKQFVAQKFGVSTDRVGQLGESYFTHAGVTPQRVYPFIVSAEGYSYGPDWKYTAMRRLWILLYTHECFSGDFVKALARTHLMYGNESQLCPERAPEARKNQGYALSLDKEEVSVSGLEHRIPSRVLGERKYLEPKKPDVSMGSQDIDKKTPELPFPFRKSGETLNDYTETVTDNLKEALGSEIKIDTDTIIDTEGVGEKLHKDSEAGKQGLPGLGALEPPPPKLS